MSLAYYSYRSNFRFNCLKFPYCSYRLISAIAEWLLSLFRVRKFEIQMLVDQILYRVANYNFKVAELLWRYVALPTRTLWNNTESTRNERMSLVMKGYLLYSCFRVEYGFEKKR